MKIMNYFRKMLAFTLFLVMAMAAMPVLASGLEYHDRVFQSVWNLDLEDDKQIISQTYFVSISGNPLQRMGLIVHEEDSDLFLVKEIKYIGEYGFIESIRMYADSQALASADARNATGSGRHRVSRTHTWAMGHGSAQVRWAEGYFSYNSQNNTVTLSNIRGHVYDTVNSIRITNRSTTQSNGTSFIFGLGRQWRQVNFSFTATTHVGISNNFSVSARVYSNGNRNN